MFYYHNNRFQLEDTSLEKLAKEYETPLYVYSHSLLEESVKAYQKNRDTVRPFYAVKANDRLGILSLLKDWGMDFAIVSLGELEKLLHLKIEPHRIIFSGPAKRDDELRRAISVGIHSIQVEGMNELERIIKISSELKKKVSIALRLNFDLKLDAHQKIQTGGREHKFGIASTLAIYAHSLLKKAPHVHLIGLSTHIGSMVWDLDTYKTLFKKLQETKSLLGLEDLTYLNVGGGLAVDSRTKKAPKPEKLTQMLHSFEAKELIYVEPGRSIVAHSGGLLTKVISAKSQLGKHFLFLDAGMNDFMKPSLYNAEHEVHNIELNSNSTPKEYTVVGPICESSGKFCEKLMAARIGDLIWISAAGAYGSSMSSQYNARGRVAEVVIKGSEIHLIQKREPLETLWRLESKVQEK